MRVTGWDPAPGRVLCVTTEGGVIADVLQDPDAGDGLWLAPGLVDMQVNGFAAHDVNATDVTPRTVQAGLAVHVVAVAGEAGREFVTEPRGSPAVIPIRMPER